MRSISVTCLLACIAAYSLVVTPVSAGEILSETGRTRVVSGDRAVRLTRGLVPVPEPTDVPTARISTMLDSLGVSFDKPTVAALARGVEQYGWAQRETEPVGNTDRLKVRVYAASDSVVLRTFDDYDRVTGEAVTGPGRRGMRATRYDLPELGDRTAREGLHSPEMWIIRQEHLQKQFFESIMNLSYTGLEAAKQAYDTGKPSLALYEVAEYYRRKTSPAALIQQPVVAPAVSTHAGAEKVLAHTFSQQGFTVQMGDRIEWQVHPEGAPAEEWLWNFNHHSQFVTLLRGYLATSNEEYAKEYVREITDFVLRCPAPPYSITRVEAWRNLEAGERAAGIWPKAFYGFLSSPNFTPQAIQIVLTGLWSHGNYIYEHPAGLRRPSNWSIIDSSGLSGVAQFFPEFGESEMWRVTAYERLTHQLKLQVYEDGAQYELAPGYHRYCLSRFQRAMDLAEQSENELPEDFARIVESMYAYVMWLSKPDGTQPAFSDSRAEDVRRELREGARRFGRQDFLYVGTGGAEGVEPEATSYLATSAGYAVMRSGWDADARYLAFDGGPVGSGHQHEDKLSIIVSAYGVPFLMDTGPFVYRATKWRDHAVSTWAHSTAVIDGQGQNRIRNGRENYAADTPTPVWETSPERDYVAAQYDAGYGEDSIAVVHGRHVLFSKPDYWIVVDEFTGEGEHEIETLFQFAPNLSVEADAAGTVTATSESGPRLIIRPASADAVDTRIVEGQEEPSVLGWYEPHDKEPAPVASYRTTAPLPYVQAYLLMPQKSVEDVPAVTSRKDGDQLVVTVGTDEYRFPLGGEK